jgi:hypothetical protein
MSEVEHMVLNRESQKEKIDHREARVKMRKLIKEKESKT